MLSNFDFDPISHGLFYSLMAETIIITCFVDLNGKDCHLRSTHFVAASCIHVKTKKKKKKKKKNQTKTLTEMYVQFRLRHFTKKPFKN